MDIDRQRVAAVQTLEALGFRFQRAVGCPRPLPQRHCPGSPMLTTGSREETELKAVVDAIEAYKAKRWPLGKDPAVPGGKG